MADDNLTLYVATYDDARAAGDDFAALKAARADGLVLVAAVVMERLRDLTETGHNLQRSGGRRGT